MIVLPTVGLLYIFAWFFLHAVMITCMTLCEVILGLYNIIAYIGPYMHCRAYLFKRFSDFLFQAVKRQDRVYRFAKVFFLLLFLIQAR